MIKTAFTCGDINGIGPEIIIKSLNSLSKNQNHIYVLIPLNVFEYYQKYIPINFDYKIHNSFEKPIVEEKGIHILNIGEAELNIGYPTTESGRISYQSIIKSLDLFDSKIIDSIVTAPISKKAFNLAGINFPGHTELLADYFNEKKFGMFFIGSEFNTSLLTIHKPLKSVSDNITSEKLEEMIELSIWTLKNDFRIASPKIAVLGLNPHAGEEGVISDEEIKIYNPVIQKYSSREVEGPFVPDAFFGLKLYKNYDLVIGSYHDQVLIPFKMLNFDSGVNYTAGLPVVRTSPDHGTAFDIAGKGIADERSFLEAYKLAVKIVTNRNRINP